jgi:hypothetical protein
LDCNHVPEDDELDDEGRAEEQAEVEQLQYLTKR